MKIMMYEKAGKFSIFVGDNVECFSICSPRREFYRIGDNFIFNGDEGGRVEQFDGDILLGDSRYYLN